MAEQKQIQKKIRFALSSQTSKENLSFVILLMLMSLVRTRFKLSSILLTVFPFLLMLINIETFAEGIDFCFDESNEGRM